MRQWLNRLAPGSIPPSVQPCAGNAPVMRMQQRHGLIHLAIKADAVDRHVFGPIVPA